MYGPDDEDDDDDQQSPSFIEQIGQTVGEIVAGTFINILMSSGGDDEDD